MIIVRKLSETHHAVEHLTLAAKTLEECELLEALYRDYAQTGVLDVTLRNGQRLRSGPEDRRRSPRINLQRPVLLFWNEGEQEHREQSFTSNLSRFGCAIKSCKFFWPKTPVRIQYQAKVMEARTVYSLADHSRKLVEVGIDFGGDVGDFWGLHLGAE